MSNEIFKPQKFNLANARCRVMYNDSSIQDDLGLNYKNLKRVDMKSVTVIADGKPIYTLQIINNKLIYRIRNLAQGIAGNGKFSFAEPKRCFILATEGKIVFVWDDGDIDELNDWEVNEPYTKPPLLDEEK